MHNCHSTIQYVTQVRCNKLTLKNYVNYLSPYANDHTQYY